MDLVTLRERFVTLAGRYDLVVDTTDWEDNGADFFINHGQKFLSKLVSVPENKASLFFSLAAGEYAVTFQEHCRAIEKVYVNNTEDRYELTKLDMDSFKEYYYEPVADITNAAPVHYALAELRALETTDQTSIGTFLAKNWTEDETKYDYRGVIVGPPVDETYVVEVIGLFAQGVLSSDTDKNWWSEEYPEILVMSAMRSMEIFNRNTEGKRDWTEAIQDEVIGIEKDVAHEESSGVNQMEG